ncbi:MAG: hypothetical protein ACRD9R_00055 [Pyrinomonadaceae bacterium]
MDERGRGEDLEPSTRSDYEVSAGAPTLPAFDADAVHNARPAVPLQSPPQGPRQSLSRSAGPVSAVLLLLCAGIAGGLLALGAFMFYQRRPAAADQSRRNVNAPPSSTATTTQGKAVNTATAPAATEQRQAGNTNAVRQTPAQPNTEQPARQPEATPSASRPEGERISQPANSAAEGERQAAADGRDESEGDDNFNADDVVAESGRLRGAFASWLAATNSRDIKGQMQLYGRQVNAYYRARNVSRADVRAEKSRVFGSAEVIDVRAGEPEITINPNGRTATMRFRKEYVIAGGGQDRRGAVMQELKWRRTKDGWKIVGERDLRVIR